MAGSAESVRELAPTLTIPIPSPPEGERVRVRGSTGRGKDVHE